MQVGVTVGLSVDFIERLAKITERKRISRNKLMKEGIEMAILKYESEEDAKSSS